MMKKRIFALALAVVMLFSFSACDFMNKTETGESSMNAYELYTKIMEKNQSAMYGATMNVDMDMEMPGMTIEMGIEQIFESYNGNYNLTYSQTAAGQTNTIDIVYVNGVAYLEQDGEKIKMTIDGEELIEMIGAINFLDTDDAADEENPFDDLINEETLKEVKVKVKDGKLSFTVDVNAEKANELFGSTTDEIGAEDEVTYKGASLTMTCDKDYNLVSVAVSMEMDTVSDETAMTIKATITLLDFVSEKPTIKAPANKNSYVDYDDIY